MVISQMYFRDGAASAFPVDADFNDRVYAYNKYMYDACHSFEAISFWSYQGMVDNWRHCISIQYNTAGMNFFAKTTRRA